MKIGLYSITYLGCWYRGEALTLPELIHTAKQFGYDGVEFDGKRPHANPLDWPKHKCQELLRVAEGEGIEILGVAFIGEENKETESTISEIAQVRRLGRLPWLSPLTADALEAAFESAFHRRDFI